MRALRSDSGPPLFYFLEKPLVHAAEALSLPDAAARILPFLAILLLFTAAPTLPAGRPRRLFLLLTAMSPLLLLYSAEARAYAPLALLNFWLFLLAIREPRSMRGVLAIAAVAALALWMHYLALFFVAALAIACFFGGRRRSSFALLGGVVLALPWLPVLLRQPAEATAWMRDRVGSSMVGFLSALGGAGRVPAPFGAPLPSFLFWIAAAVAVALVFLLSFSLWEGGFRARRTAAIATPELGIGFVTVVPMLAGVLMASFLRPVAFAGRTEMAVLPVWLWVIARASEASRPIRWIAAASVVVSVAACFFLLLAAPTAPPVQAFLLGRVEREAAAQDTAVASSTFYLRARLASERGELAARLVPFPSDLADHPGWFSPRPAPEQEYESLSDALSGAGRVFLLLDPPYRTSRLEALLRERGELREIAVYSRGVLLLSTPR